VFFPRQRLVIELDGRSHDAPGQREHDAGRDAYLASRGLRTCRIPNRMVMANPAVCRAILLSELGIVAWQPGSPRALSPV
jgi:very-short-patch-repair endonuclease